TISPPSPVVIPAGNTSTTITIAMKEDTLYESDETVIVALGTPTNATLATPATYTFTIKDDDQEPSVSWNPAESNLSEPEGTQGSGTQTRQVTYTMVLSAASGLPVSVPIMYTGTATFGTDYTGPATVMFQPGETSTNVVLEIVKDLVPEPGPAETITMTINSGGVTNATPQMPLVRAYSIQDDD
ncbi:MAG TPA: Calx-beta domain-containing protein, partial [Kofleriaceae bacterium]